MNHPRFILLNQMEEFIRIQRVKIIPYSQEEDDLAYEEDILRNPYSVKCWLRYVDHKKDGSKNSLNLVFERALKELPGR